MTEATNVPENPKIGKNRGNAGKGRPKGALNKSTAEIKAAAQMHGAAAIKRLAQLMFEAESEQAQIAAAKELLDRGYGKAVQAIEASGPDGAPIAIQKIALEFIKP